MQMQTNLLSSLPPSKLPAPQTYTFSGNSYSVAMKSQQLTQANLSAYNSLQLTLTGTIVKGNDVCCFWATVVLGIIFIIPLIILCTNWWKRKVNKLFEVDMDAYHGVAHILDLSIASELYLMVEDHMFDEKKAQVLNQALKRSRIRNIVFKNCVYGFNTVGNNFGQFQNYMADVMQTVGDGQISWGNKFVK